MRCRARIMRAVGGLFAKLADGGHTSAALRPRRSMPTTTMASPSLRSPEAQPDLGGENVPSTLAEVGHASRYALYLLKRCRGGGI